MTPRYPSLRHKGLLRRAGMLVTGTATVLVVSLTATASSHAATNLLTNPGLEQIGPGGFPSCWNAAGWGDNDFTFTLTDQAHGGGYAMQLTITALTSGDRKLMMAESTQCAPEVLPGGQYDLGVWYKSSTPNAIFTAFRHDVNLGWQYWTDLASLPVTSEWSRASVRTPPVPAFTDQIVWGITLYGVGTLVTDDYEMTDPTEATPIPGCTDPVGCVKGVWDVMAYESPVRGIHSVLLHDGRVLLVAGSGNSQEMFDAGTFKTTVYDPVAETFTPVPTPADLFCAGHVQLSDGRVLVMGGNLDYPAVDGSHGYKGLRDSFIFDPATNSYVRTNDMAAGHWYPSATVLGNGDVLSLGGLGEDSNGTVATEYWDASEGRWLRLGESNQTWRFWGLYPAMILMADGRLFYTGSHVFGNGLPGTGASIYDYAAGTVTDVPGLRNKDERDQSMSVLLPPAQDQRVLTVGGGNIVSNPDANRLTDLIDLGVPDPAYTPGPLLPQGTLDGGVHQHGDQGKMYVSLVILPDGTVFETGGGLHNRADPVYEASMFDPATDTFVDGMATDPIPRTYHSSAFLLPDGRVMAVGDNPGDGSFNLKISIYRPPYLFKGPRPEIVSVRDQVWTYGSQQLITVDRPVARAALIRPAAVTHSSDPNQRYVELPMTVHSDTSIGLNLTTNPNLAPPGWYMLFTVDSAGIPSVAEWVRVG